MSLFANRGKSLLILLAIACLPLGAKAQDHLLWRSAIGGSKLAAANAVAALPDGYAVLGVTTRNAAPGFYDRDFWFLRLGAKGDTLWTRRYGGGFEDAGHALAALPDGGFLLVGASNSFTTGHFDALVYRIDAKGDTLWSRSVGGSGEQLPFAVFAARDGGFLLGGASKGSDGRFLSWVCKLSPEGDTEWAHTFGEAHQGVRGILELGDGRIAARIPNGQWNSRDERFEPITRLLSPQGLPLPDSIFSRREHWPGMQAATNREGQTLVTERTELLQENTYTTRPSAANTDGEAVVSLHRPSTPPEGECRDWTLLVKPPLTTVANAEDSRGRRWAASPSQGLFVEEEEIWWAYNTRNSDIPSDNLAAVGADYRGHVWVATRDAGLGRFDGQSWTVYNAANSQLPADALADLRVDTADNVYVKLMEDGRWIRRSADGQWELGLQDPSLARYRDTRGNVWSLVGEDLVLRSPDGGNLHVPLPSDLWSLRSMALDRKGDILLSTFAGLWKWADCGDSRARRVHSDPRLALDPEGRALVAWKGEGHWRNFGVFHQRFGADMRPAGPPVRADDIVRGWPLSPRVAANGKGEWRLGWIHHTGTKAPTYFGPGPLKHVNLRLFTAFDKVPGPIEVHPPKGLASGAELYEIDDSFELAVDDSGGGLALLGVVLEARGPGWPIWSLATIPFRKDGSTENGLLIRHNRDNRQTEGPQAPRILARADGSYLVGVVMQGSSLQIQMLAPNLSLGRSLPVPEPRSRPVRPALCAFPDGRFSVAYDQDDGHGLLIQSYDAQGAPAAPYAAAAPPGKYAGHRLSCGEDGRLLLAYLKEGLLHFRRFDSQTDTAGSMFYFPRAGLKAFDAAWAPDGSVALATIAEGADTVAVEKVDLETLSRTPIGIQAMSRPAYRFRPRLAGGVLHVDLPAAARVRLEVLDVRGRLLAVAYEGPGRGEPVAIPFGSQEPGLRMLRLRADGHTHSVMTMFVR